MTNEQREAIKTLSDTNILMNIQRDTALSLIKEQQEEIELYKEELDSIYKALDIERGVARPRTDKIIRALKNTIQSQARQIDLMAEQLAGLTIWDTEEDEPLILGDKEEVINYFENKVNSKIQ